MKTLKLTTRDMVLASLFAALMTVGAYLKILAPPVPFSLQTFFCVLAGMILGSRLGTLSQILYAALGLAGLPVFTQGGGPLYFLKPSSGFLLGFILGAYVTGKVSEALGKMSFRNALLSAGAGLLALNAVGVSYLYFILRFYMGNPGITFSHALTIGFFPFIIKDMMLSGIAAAIACIILPALKKAGLIGC